MILHDVQVILEAPLSHQHFGAAAPFTHEAILSKSKFDSVDTRAYVILLTRSISVVGDNGDDQWGPVVRVGEEREESESNGLKGELMCGCLSSHACLLMCLSAYVMCVGACVWCMRLFVSNGLKGDLACVLSALVCHLLLCSCAHIC